MQLLRRKCDHCLRVQTVEFRTHAGRLAELPLGCGCDALAAKGLCVVCRRSSGRYVGVCNGCRQKRARVEVQKQRRCVDCGGPPRTVRALRCVLCHGSRRNAQARRFSLEYYHRTKGGSA